MTIYNMLDAKNNLSKICRDLTNGDEDFILIANNGEPVAKITPYKKTYQKRVGCLEGKYNYNPDIDWFNDDMTKLFFGEE